MHVETWKGAYRGQISDEVLDTLSVEARADAWRTLLREGDRRRRGTWVAERASEIAGFANAGHATGELYAIYHLRLARG